MDTDTAHFLLTDDGISLIACAAEHVDDTLRAGRVLARQYPDLPPSFRAGAIEVADARRRASDKLPHAESLYLTREAVEQSTGRDVARHRAERFRNAGQLHDCCCGLGGDAFALGGMAASLTCIDRDPVRVLFCRENLRRLGVEAEVVEADVAAYTSCINASDLVFIDPSRRSGERRTVKLDAMSPPIAVVGDLLAMAHGGAVKLPPALDMERLPMTGEIEWISTADGLKEALLWTGSLRGDDVTVTLLHRNSSLSSSSLPDEEAPVAAPGDYLYEPDPALIRSGLLARKAASLGMWRIDPSIAYLSADAYSNDPFLTGYRIIESLPFNLKRLRDVLRGLDAGRLVVKKRGFPLSPEELQRKLALDGSCEMTLVACRIGDGHHIFIVERSD